MFNVVVCGGTFDHFHKGHESFLRYVFSVGKKYIVGITSDKFVRRWKIDDRSWKQIEPFKIRKQAVLEFVKKEKVLNKIEIVKIDDLFGSTLSKELMIDGIVVSEETKKGAEIINQKRKGLGLIPLEVFITLLVKAEDGKLISSERIRRGEIDRTGKLYVKPAWIKTDLVLPENLREEFRKPFGELLNIENLIEPKNSLIITVGDITTKIFNEKSLRQNISAVDFKVARKEAFSSFSDLGFHGDEKVIIAENSAGHITHDLFSKILNIFEAGFNKRIILKIEGEEDLVVLPLILAAPLNTIIYYGQPNTGLVKVLVSEENKEQAYSLVSKFRLI